MKKKSGAKHHLSSFSFCRNRSPTYQSETTAVAVHGHSFTVCIHCTSKSTGNFHLNHPKVKHFSFYNVVLTICSNGYKFFGSCFALLLPYFCVPFSLLSMFLLLTFTVPHKNAFMVVHRCIHSLRTW